MTDKLTVRTGQRYRHTKSAKLYEIVGLAFQTETEELLVIYKPLYETDYELFARPYTMFIELVKINGVMRPRFEKINEPTSYIV